MSLSTRQRSSAPSQADKGQTNPLGVILVFGIMIAGATVVVVLGASAMDATEQTLSEQRAEKVMTQLDSKASLVALGETDSQRISYSRSSGERFRTVNGTGWLRVNITNKTTDSTTTIMNQSMGEAVFDRQDTRIAYQGGGVWRQEGDGSAMVSPPEFHYRDATLTLPLVSVTGDALLGNSALVTKNGTTEQTFPNGSLSDEWTNPLDNHEINVTVESRYYEAWGRYFETRTEGDVVYDHPNNRATIELVVPADYPPVNAGVIAGAPGGTLEVDQTAEVDSYNSSDSTYGTFPDSSDTKLVAAGDIDVLNNAEIHGNVEAGRWINVSNNGHIYGNAQYGTSIQVANNGDIDGWTAQNSTVEIPNAMDSVIEDSIDDLRSDGDSSPAITGSDRLTGCGSTCELTAGSYYLDRIDLGSGETLRLDSDNGEINLAVDGDVTIADDAEIVATDDNRTNVYVGGDADIGGQSGDVTVAVENDRTPRLWFYMRSDRQIHFRQHAGFQGVVYGPGGRLSPGVDIVMDNQAEVWGALVGDVPNLDNQNVIHYDEALANADSVQELHNVPAITYLHVSVNRIHVTD